MHSKQLFTLPVPENYGVMVDPLNDARCHPRYAVNFNSTYGTKL